MTFVLAPTKNELVSAPAAPTLMLPAPIINPWLVLLTNAPWIAGPLIVETAVVPEPL